jgi:hypothetical protein
MHWRARTPGEVRRAATRDCVRYLFLLTRSRSPQARRVRFADARVRDAPFDVAAACVAWVQDKHFRRCYTRLQSAAADDDGALCTPLGVRAA